ncbi:NnrS family protein [Pseudomonadota bacterium]
MTPGLVPFALGFRPFFLCAGAAGTLLLPLWLAFWSGALQPTPYYGGIGWHSHEMLFGYSTAVLAGFLLTAVRNWTGIDTITGKPLAALAGVWLAGRIMPFLPVPGALIALVDLAFVPLLVLALSKPLWQGSNKVNRFFIPLLGSMAIANLLLHLQALGITETTASSGVALMRNLVLLIILLVTGRIMPFFTERAIMGSTPKNRELVERLSFGSLLALAVVELLLPGSWAVGLLATAFTLIQMARMAGWYDKRIWGLPILWVLYTGYFWLILGYGLLALSAFGLTAPNLALHAITVGGIGVLTLGMMARVALGHSGRPLQTAPIINVAFILLNLAAAIRVLAPIAAPQMYLTWIHLSGGIWALCFLLFCAVYIPILIKPRSDGMPG